MVSFFLCDTLFYIMYVLWILIYIMYVLRVLFYMLYMLWVRGISLSLPPPTLALYVKEMTLQDGYTWNVDATA